MSTKGQEPGGEPSMEEILASIRRIISEDPAEQAAAAPAPAPVAAVVPPPPPPAAPAPAPVAPVRAAAMAMRIDDDVLNLTNRVEEEPLPALTRGGAFKVDVDAPAPAPRPSARFDIDTSAEPAPSPARGSVMKMDFDMPDAPETPAARGLLSEEAVSSATTAFAQLGSVASRPSREKDGLRMGAGDRTLEELVVEAIKPMLREWLDQNLPALVEDLVREEIERVTQSLRRR